LELATPRLRESVKNLGGLICMTTRKLLLTLSIILGCGLIVGGIVSAQEAQAPKAPKASKAPKAQAQAQAQADAQAEADFNFNFDFDMLQDAPQDREFTFFMGGTYLGVRAEDVSKENMGRYSMREVRGVGVTEVLKDSPAEKAGLRKDDVIVGFNGEPVTSARKLNRLVAESSADQNVRLTISRGGAEQEFTATLAARKPNHMIWNGKLNDDLKMKIEKMQKDFPKIKDGDGNFTFAWGSNRRIGVSSEPLTKQLAEYFGVTEGILITSVNENSPAAKAGLKAGDVITAVDGEKVDSPGDVSRVINKKQDGPVTLTIVRDRATLTVTVTPEKPAPGSGADIRIVVPPINFPSIPPVNINVPNIVVPAPAINVTVPAVIRRSIII
jgi:serine protease Do